jgi:uncharacterized protein YdgA (DUF945 family)
MKVTIGVLIAVAAVATVMGYRTGTQCESEAYTRSDHVLGYDPPA